MKKSLFRRMTALLCCILLFVVPMKPAVYAAATDATLQLNLGEFKIYNENLEEFTETVDFVDYDGQWQYTYTGGVMNIQAIPEGTALKGSTVYFLIEAAVAPTISKTPVTCKISTPEAVPDNGKMYWLYEVTMPKTNSACKVTFTPGKEYVDVTFPVDYDNYRVKYNDQYVDGETVSV